MELPLLLLIKVLLSLIFLSFVSFVINTCETLILKPSRLRSKLRSQGIQGPSPSFLKGNIPDINKAQSSKHSNGSSPAEGEQVTSHNYSINIFPYLVQWTKQYGSLFVFSLGNKQILYMNDPDVVKEMSIYTSLDLGKPSYQFKERAPLLGQGILTSSGVTWARQRKIIAPELYMDKVKRMMDVMVESSIVLVNSWKDEIESRGVAADIKIDDDLKSFSADVISRACFGSSYLEGADIFKKFRDLQGAMFKRFLSTGIPGLRNLPTKSNREVWSLEREIRGLILEVVEQRKQAKSKDLLQMILQGAASSELGPDATERFIVDNCKNIYLAGYETTAASATWTLMLLASNPEWQDRVRAEVLEICKGQLPDASMIRQMKTLTMVINESLRLYPPVAVVSREALKDLKLGDIYVPKGVNMWTVVVTLHQDPEIWGPDADKFNPERFVNGVTGACKLPHAYIPFGVGPRTCVGQNFALVELKVLIAIILSNFSFSLSPKYKHCPALTSIIEPRHGVNLLINRLESTRG